MPPKTPTATPAIQAMPPHGGRWLRDPQTGALSLVKETAPAPSPQPDVAPAAVEPVAPQQEQ